MNWKNDTKIMDLNPAYWHCIKYKQTIKDGDSMKGNRW